LLVGQLLSAVHAVQTGGLLTQKPEMHTALDVHAVPFELRALETWPTAEGSGVPGEDPELQPLAVTHASNAAKATNARAASDTVVRAALMGTTYWRG
jgi:hypothetical protein